ncbi:unnamed protein product [Ostreobium quekettii]|uniref:PsbP C-terminal domain-containing protein n=1 Tax=Ostreobium quekettii TaxID=121088 RepID=A0A8S1JAA1_9CHLO|nr:unnamed protein product [Ostreobium quekettii]|eukprot:evm.model.scf_753.2 EVM.evm.TU.scf_753.2   scf_753:27010-29157(+)
MQAALHGAPLRARCPAAPARPHASIRSQMPQDPPSSSSRPSGPPTGDLSIDRRTAFLGMGAASVALAVDLAVGVPVAGAEDMETFFGYATPPTSYGGYGGNADEPPKYKFQYPASWKPQTVNKVQKGTQGIDSIIVNPRNKSSVMFVIALGRAGEDDKSFKLTDVETTFQGFVGADYELQDAVQSASSIARTSREVGGEPFYDYDIDSPNVHVLSTVTVRGGKIFAFIIKVPTRQYESQPGTFKTALTSFRTL